MASLAALRHLRSRGLLRRFKEQARGRAFSFNQSPVNQFFVDELLLESLPGSLTTEWCGVLGATP
jgi:hypothetical protein